MANCPKMLNALIKRIPLGLKVSFFLQREWLRKLKPYTVAIVTIAVLIVPILILYFVFPKSESNSGFWNNTELFGLVAALLGAVVGGVLTAVVTVEVQLQQAHAQAILEKKNNIYMPLYIELVSLRDYLANAPTMVSSFRFHVVEDRDRYDRYIEGEFAVWTLLKENGYTIQIPKWLATGLNEIEEKIEKLMKDWKMVARDFGKDVEKSLREAHKSKNTGRYNYDLGGNFGSYALSSLLHKESESQTIFVNSNNKNLTGLLVEDIKALNERVISKGLDLESVKTLKGDYDILKQDINIIVISIEKVIRFIEKEFQGLSGQI